MVRKNIFLLLILYFNACSINNGTRSSILLYNDITENNYKLEKLENITKKYGKYSQFWPIDNQTTIYQYSFTKSQYDLVSYLPLINHFGWIRLENYEILIFVDSDNKIVKSQKFHHLAKLRNSMICNPYFYSCLRAIYNKSINE